MGEKRMALMHCRTCAVGIKLRNTTINSCLHPKEGSLWSHGKRIDTGLFNSTLSICNIYLLVKRTRALLRLRSVSHQGEAGRRNARIANSRTHLLQGKVRLDEWDGWQVSCDLRIEVDYCKQVPGLYLRPAVRKHTNPSQPMELRREQKRGA